MASFFNFDCVGFYRTINIIQLYIYNKDCFFYYYSYFHYTLHITIYNNMYCNNIMCIYKIQRDIIG